MSEATIISGQQRYQHAASIIGARGPRAHNQYGSNRTGVKVVSLVASRDQDVEEPLDKGLAALPSHRERVAGGDSIKKK